MDSRYTFLFYGFFFSSFFSFDILIWCLTRQWPMTGRNFSSSPTHSGHLNPLVALEYITRQAAQLSLSHKIRPRTRNVWRDVYQNAPYAYAKHPEGTWTKTLMEEGRRQMKDLRWGMTYYFELALTYGARFRAAFLFDFDLL